MSDSTQVAPASATATPDLAIVDGQITTTSQQIAGHFGKAHRSVLLAIRRLECSPDFRLHNFVQSSYLNEQGKEQPCYRLTRDGFVFLAMGFTGKEAAQWKEAYITAFNKMEAELQAKSTRPYNPAIDYDRISPAQAQDLKEIVDAIVKAGVQGFGETWKRLQHKFKVNSYLELPATRHLEARQYLIAKLPRESADNVFDEEPKARMSLDDSVRLDHAFHVATQTAAKVQRVVFKGIMSGNADWRHGRYLLGMSPGGSEEDVVVQLQPVAYDACVVPIDRFHAVIEDTVVVEAETLTQLASTCMTRLGRMAQGVAIAH